jgi:hypothetical protein
MSRCQAPLRECDVLGAVVGYVTIVAYSGNSLRWALVLALLTLAVPAGAAASTTIVFRTPKNDIHCGYLQSGSSVSLQCRVQAGMKPLPRITCDGGDPGHGVEMRRRGAAIAGCYGDPGFNLDFAKRHPFVLAYGHVWRRDGFLCVSRRTGLTCRNLSDHGWWLKGRSWWFF